MKRTAKWIRGVGVAVSIALALALAWIWYVAHPPLWPQYRQANTLIEAVEQFRSTNGRFPSSLMELPGQPASETGPVYYQTTGEGYEVWFGRSLGESYIYDSSSRSWH